MQQIAQRLINLIAATPAATNIYPPDNAIDCETGTARVNVGRVEDEADDDVWKGILWKREPDHQRDVNVAKGQADLAHDVGKSSQMDQSSPQDAQTSTPSTPDPTHSTISRPESHISYKGPEVPLPPTEGIPGILLYYACTSSDRNIS